MNEGNERVWLLQEASKGNWVFSAKKWLSVLSIENGLNETDIDRNTVLSGCAPGPTKITTRDK